MLLITEMVKELSVMDKATQTAFQKPSLFLADGYQKPESNDKPFSRMVKLATFFEKPESNNNNNNNLFAYSIKYPSKSMCPETPCMLLSSKKNSVSYMREVHRQLHAGIKDMWKQLCSFCLQPVTLLQSKSPNNPNRMYLGCQKKQCKFFQVLSNVPLSQKNWDWIEDNKGRHRYFPTRDSQGYPLYGYDIPGPPLKLRPKDKQGDPLLTDYEKELLRRTYYEKELLQEIHLPPAPPKYSSSLKAWQKEKPGSVTCDCLKGCAH